MKQTHSIDMTHGPLLGKLIAFAVPLALSGMLQQLFNSADIAVVGRFAGSAAQAAVGCNSPVITLLIGLFTGLTIGANAEIAACVGREDHSAVERAVHTVMAMALISGVFLLGFGILIARPLLILVNTPEDILDDAVLYLRIYFAGVPFVMLYNFGAAVLRSRGDTRRPTVALILAGILNVALNLLTVIVFGMGVAGVALATSISNLFSGALVIYYLLREEAPFTLHIKQLRMDRRALAQVLRIGLPAGIQSVVFPLSNVCIQSAINTLGSAVIAGSSDALTLELYSYYLLNAFVQTSVTFTAQNYAAGQYNRCRRVQWMCMASAVVSVICTGAVLFGLRNPIMALFTTDPEVARAGIVRMSYVLVLQFMANSYEISAASMRGIGVSLLPSLITVIGTCLLRIVWVYAVFPMRPTFEFLLLIYPISWVITGSSMLTALFLVWRKHLPKGDTLRGA